MNYWKGLAIAATLDLAWLLGSPARMGPDTLPPVEVVMTWHADTMVTSNPEVANLTAVSITEDSLMTHLNEQPGDVDAMERLAALYMEQGWYVQAFGPLARALQIDPDRRSLWVALDKAVEGAGWAKITDAELTRHALAFLDDMDMWGHGC